jgi:hypothetical protein
MWYFVYASNMSRRQIETRVQRTQRYKGDWNKKVQEPFWLRSRAGGAIVESLEASLCALKAVRGIYE